MQIAIRRPSIILWVGVTLLLPGMLCYSALRTYRSLEDQQGVYLRSRIAQIASQLEILSPSLSRDEVIRALDEESGLLDVAIFDPPADPAKDPLAPLWLGHELFQTETLTVSGQAVFRGFVPFHAASGLKVARIDVAQSSSDFLVEHARHHLAIVTAGSILFIGLSILLAIILSKLLRAQQRQAGLEHLAHLGQMSAVLAHEIRNPLGTIKGFAQLLQERLPSEHNALLQPILAESTRLEILVKDLLLYGRPAQPIFSAITSAAVVERLRPHLGQISQGIRVEIQVTDVTFETDLNLLEQALLNLMKNSSEALHASPDAVLCLAGEQTRERVVWRVTDNGPGFSAEARERMFEPFYTSKAFGTGLGLSITRKIVEALGGHLSIAAVASGGTAAEIRLPRRAAPSAE